MSLDVYLYPPNGEVLVTCEHCAGTGKVRPERHWLFDGNVTHNLIDMAEAAGLYDHLWQPEKLGITKADELIEPLRKGLQKLHETPAEFKKHNPPNGWGTYEGFVEFIRRYLRACETNPDAIIEVSR